MEKTVFWIHMGFNVDPDTAFYLNADPDPEPESQTHADRSDFKVTKSSFFNEK
jgi:hypothetical protein